MEYYNNKALEIIIKNQKATNENLFTLNNNQRNHTNSIFKLIEFNRSLIYDLKEENKSLREDLKEIKSVFNLDKQSTEDEVISSPPKEYQEMIDLLSKSINYLNLDDRAYNCLISVSIRNLADLVKLNKKTLMRIRMLGRKSFNLIINALAEHKLTLEMDISKYEPYLELNIK
tara:strand:+ start:51 stop:569 length:519 start_codon:yes stop_codon:yes gene_type:complete